MKTFLLIFTIVLFFSMNGIAKVVNLPIGFCILTDLPYDMPTKNSKCISTLDKRDISSIDIQRNEIKKKEYVSNNGVMKTYMSDEELKSFGGDRSLKPTGKLMKDDILTLNVFFTPEGIAKIQKLTSENINRYLGLIIGDYIISAPTIAFPFEGKSLKLDFDFTKSKAKDIITKNLQ